ncbi:hypothetical protein [Haloferax sp. DFSO60]|uniref:hypothetical protein n=1 Tax=Haloferax sp. DFSO60 TaxID=3388652 RepID=UPI00397B12DF
MRFVRELAVVVVLLALFGALVRSGTGRIVLPLVSLVVAAGLVILLLKQPAYARTTVGSRTRILDSTGSKTDAQCVECDAPATRVRRYVRELVVLGVPVVLLEDGRVPVCDDHRK